MGQGTADRAGPGGVDVTVPNIARIYDYFLGGKDNFAADRAAAEQILKAVPDAPRAARANRAFLSRAVRHLAAEAGVRQFLDIGAGLPTRGNVHEVARAAATGCRVVYVDNDPVVLSHGRALMSGDPDTAVVAGDLRNPEAILADPEVAGLIDFAEPVAVLLVAILHFVPDREDPWDLVARLTSGLAPGSHLVVSHGYEGGMREGTSEEAREVYRRSNSAIHSRGPDQVARFLTGFDLLDPGVVWVPEWRPDPGEEPADGAASHFLGAVGRLSGG